ncbi:hypothetical protein L0B70_07895 [Kaistella sp. 97-N-M2]|uniref:hypothetical protein n=1 Tax=Kaistella sp. 97-N-M2 TaxID=2908645 RepID=UPI001F1FB833|nr:hypothetical protein [Kaistella sp. 97-N-M2]UJF28790.1 hypothetical protein L0B70_07895 [Kaistella sp. 97-N-M2]
MYLIAAMIKQGEKIIIIKTAITLRTLLNRNKTLQLAEPNKDIVSSYEKIAINSSSDLTKATVNNAFSGVKRSAMTTIVVIIECMGYNLSEFAAEYDKITDEEITSFQKEIIEEKNKKS